MTAFAATTIVVAGGQLTGGKSNYYKQEAQVESEMSESLRDILEDIHRKLVAGAYQNEEHVRLSLVAREVQGLGWDIWNPGGSGYEVSYCKSGRKS